MARMFLKIVYKEDKTHLRLCSHGSPLNLFYNVATTKYATKKQMSLGLKSLLLRHKDLRGSFLGYKEFSGVYLEFFKERIMYIVFINHRLSTSLPVM